jgi:nicotinamide mononucleotide transporter
MTKKSSFITAGISFIGIFLFAKFLIYLPHIFLDIEAASLPYWDSTTSILSVTGMWLTAKKKIENWYYWLLVDVLATGIYFYKDLYFYSLLYFIYIGLAVAGYVAWRRSFDDRQKSL